MRNCVGIALIPATVIVLSLAATPALAQTCTASAQTYSTAGTTSTTVPGGCNTATVDVWGGGGGGGAYMQNGQNRGGGGGGGAYARKVITSLIAGNPITVIVGAGGAGGQYVDGSSWQAGATGGSSSFGSYVSAIGGAGGAAGATTNAAGGTCLSATTCYVGGTGGQGITAACADYRNGGGGGGGGGTSGAGGAGGNATTNNCTGNPSGGAAGAGGSGGGGVGAHGSYGSTAPQAPGGGGAGGCSASGGCPPGTAGAAGKVIVTWSYSTPPSNTSWTSTSNLLYTTTGSVGIGTDSPQAKLEVHGPDADAAENLVIVRKDGSVGQNLLITRIDALNRIVSLSADGSNASPRFSLGAGQLYPQHLTIRPTGNVGIGTISPTARLQVEGNTVLNGNVTVSGNIAAKYQDVAEWVEADAELPAGTVVVADPDRVNVVRASERPYDTAVTGVVSERPGVLLGEAGKNKVVVAHSGRVRVKVDATYGPISAGDLLVTSPTPGCAMRSVPLDLGGTPIHRPGSIVGKALEALDAGTGEVLALVTLQ